jgi:O-antigen ligase
MMQVSTQTRLSSTSPSLALIGISAYVGTFILQLHLPWDVPLLILAVAGIFSWLSESKGVVDVPLLFPLSFFLFSFALSIVLSVNVDRSIRLSAPFLPGLLLFFLIASYFNTAMETLRLYFIFSVLVLLLAVMLLWNACKNLEISPFEWLRPFEWVSLVGSSILVVKNDVTFLSVAAPLSLSLLFQRRFDFVVLIAGLSLLLTVAVVGMYQSRVAFLTLIVSIISFFGLLRPRLALTCGILTVCAALLVDGLVGFPLLQRFIDHWDGSGRIPLWLSAGNMFLNAPFFGTGPHTFALFYQPFLHNLSLPSWLSVDPRYIPWPHNLYIEILGESGIIGLSSFGFLIVYAMTRIVNFRQSSSKQIQVVAYGAFAGLLGFCFAACFELTFEREWVVAMMFTLLGVIAQLSSLEGIKRRENNE